MTSVFALGDRQARRYSSSYFDQAEAHWARMVARAPDTLRQFRDCLVEGANCVRIAGYDRAQFFGAFTRVAESNDLLGKFGASETLQAILNSALETYVENYAATHKKNTDANVTPIESKLLPRSTIDATDFVLMQNDAERLDKFLRGRAHFEKQAIIAYIRWKTSL